MPFVLTNITDSDLELLSSAVYDERMRRVIANVSKYPVPVVFFDTLTIVEAVKQYRAVTGLSLAESKWIVEYYREQANGEA